MKVTIESRMNTNRLEILFKKAIVTVRNNLSAWLLLIPSIFLFITIVWGPMISGIILSFFKMKGYDPIAFIGFNNYIEVLRDTGFIQTLINTFVYVFWSLLIGFVPPILIAIIINEMVHFKSFFKFAVYFPTMVPSVAGALLWYFMFQPGNAGILNLLLAKLGLPASQWLQNPHMTIPLIVTTMTWRGFGSTTILYIASLQGVNQELYESSMIDGANLWERLKNITIPQISGIILLMFVRQIIGVFQVMVEPMAMTDGGPSNASLSLNLQGYYYAFRYFRADKALALGVITFAMLMVLTVFYFKIKKKVETE